MINPINLSIIRGDYMFKYILFTLFLIIGYIIIFSLLRAASKFDDEIQKLYSDYHKDLDTNEEYDHYEQKYKNNKNS